MRRVYWVCNWLDCRENDMTTLSKDEVVRLAREGLIQQMPLPHYAIVVPK